MTSRDDATRAAVAPLLADLRSDLLVMPNEQIVEQHLGMMAFEEQVLATPRFVEKRARQRLPHPRRAVIAFVCAFSTLVSCGLSAAGALPAPLQHITESIAHTFGVPHANDTPTPPPTKAAAGAAIPHKPAADATPPTAGKPAAAAPTTSARAHAASAKVAKSTDTAPTTTQPSLPASSTQIAAPRPHAPPQRIKPVDAGPPPSKNSSNTPPGFPADWRQQATDMASMQLSWPCTFDTTLAPVGCPQEATAPAVGVKPGSVTWTLLNNPSAGAAVVAKTTPGNPTKHIAPHTNVTVYEAFQMVATYTAADDSGPYRAYSAGIGAATLTWDGSEFVNVSYSRGSVAGHLLPGVKPPSLPQPAQLNNSAVLSAVQDGFTACTASTTAPGPVLTCPQTTAPGEQWTLTGDPAQGATVAYDSTQGLFTVTGTYAMTSNLGNSAGGGYTATLFYDGSYLQVLSITAN